MKNSAMLCAFRLLRQRPTLLLLMLPAQAVSLISLAFMPDFSAVLNFGAMMDNAAMLSFQATNLLYTLASSLASLVAFTGLFVLIPPAMELLSDGAAGRGTGAGWYGRGIRRHWWKPVVTGMIKNAVLGAFALLLYVALILVVVVLVATNAASLSGVSPTSLLNNIAPAATIAGVFFGVAIAAVSLFVESFFGLFLPALADRSFGAAFRLMFGRAGLRKLPKLLGGTLLIGLASFLPVALAGTAHTLIHGVPAGNLGLISAILRFFGSAPGIMSLLLSSVIGVLQVPFQFCVHQQVRDGEAQALPAGVGQE